jgi:hypothetical protein
MFIVSNGMMLGWVGVFVDQEGVDENRPWRKISAMEW